MIVWSERVISLAINLISSALVVLLVWFRQSLAFQVRRTWRRLSVLISGRRFVLLWSDDGLDVAMRLTNALQLRLPVLQVRAVETPSGLLAYPLNSKCTGAIMLADCDVTALAETAREREAIEHALEAYVMHGGGLVATHDAIYRRVRSGGLQRLFGCQLNGFQRLDQPLMYSLSHGMDDHPLARCLAHQFDLDDGEICWGEWSSDCTVVFASAAQGEKPLVVMRSVGTGTTVWMNSADRGDEPSPVLARPAPEFLQLLENSVRMFTNEPQSSRAKDPRDTILIVAHRGQSGDEPENTVAAFRASSRRAVDAVELDVRRTADGQLVVHHDAEFAGRPIGASLLADLRESGQLATLAEVLRAVRPGCQVDIELKEAGYERLVVREALSVKDAGDLLFTSFDDDAVAAVKEAAPDVRAGLLLGLSSPQMPLRTRLSELFPGVRLRRCRADFVAPHWRLLRAGFLGRMRRAGYPVFVWTVNSEPLIRRFSESRVAALVTDRPIEARRICNELSQR